VNPFGKPVPRAGEPIGPGGSATATSNAGVGVKAPEPDSGSRPLPPSASSDTTTRGENAAPPVVPSGLDLFVAGGAIETGDVVSLASEEPGAIVRSDGPADSLVIGCAQESPAGAPEVPVATGHIAWCRVSAAYGSIAVGDRLSPSPTAGIAMKSDPQLAGASILGRAIEPLESGTALVRVLLGVK
jgi:hypothetical protein